MSGPLTQNRYPQPSALTRGRPPREVLARAALLDDYPARLIAFLSGGITSSPPPTRGRLPSSHRRRAMASTAERVAADPLRIACGGP